MLERLLQCEDAVRYCSNLITNKKKSKSAKKQKEESFVPLTEEEWSTLKELVAALQPSKIATVKLQLGDLSMPEFYKIWTVCRIHSKNQGTLKI